MLPLSPMADYLTCKEVAKILRCKRETVQGYVRTGVLAGKKVGRNWLINRVTVAEFLGRR